MTSILASVRASFATRIETPGTPAFDEMQAARWRSAVAWLTGGVLALHPLSMGFVGIAAGAAPGWAPTPLVLNAVVVAWALGVGLVQLVRFDAESPQRRGDTITLSVLVVIGLVVGLG